MTKIYLKKYHLLTLIIFLIFILTIVKLVFFANNQFIATLSGKPTLKIKLIGELTNDGNYHSLLISDVLNEKYNVVFDDKNYNVIIDGPYSNLKEIRKVDKKVVTIFYTYEASTLHLNEYDLSVGYDFINDTKYVRIPLAYSWYKNKVSTNFSRNISCAPKDKKYFACFLATNGGCNNGNAQINHGNGEPFDGCIARNRLFHKLSLYKYVASGGKYLNNIGNIIPRDQSQTSEWLSQCKFTIAYENQTHDGYITEKPFNAWLSGSLPIYYGDRKGFEDINKNSVIYAGDFSDEDDLVEYIKKVDNDDELYCSIWDQHIITDPEKNYEVIKEQLSKKLYEIIDRKLKLNK